jgi:phosphorylcholine metabolism protein LicD
LKLEERPEFHNHLLKNTYHIIKNLSKKFCLRKLLWKIGYHHWVSMKAAKERKSRNHAWDSPHFKYLKKIKKDS